MADTYISNLPDHVGSLGAGDYFVTDDGTDTTKVPATDVISTNYGFAKLPKSDTLTMTLASGFLFISESNSRYAIIRIGGTTVDAIHTSLVNVSVSKSDANTLNVTNTNTYDGYMWYLTR